jgi:hypothetical protein
MIDGNKYIEVVKTYFSFLITEFGFKLSEQTVNGNFFYDVVFKDKTRFVSISYENAEDYLQTIVFLLQDGKLPNYDDKTKTLHLNKLNAQVLSRIYRNEIILNNEYFHKFNSNDELEKKLLKSAKELRLCLKHFDEIVT